MRYGGGKLGLRSYRLTRYGHMWALDAKKSAIRAGYGWRRWKTRWAIGGAEDRIDSTFLRLLERLPDTERYEADACGGYVACK